MRRGPRPRWLGALVELVALVALARAAPPAAASVRRVWAVHDGEKVDRDAHDHPARVRNAAWDGQAIRLAGARNEVLAFQVIVEADRDGVGALQVGLPELVRRGGGGRLAYAPPGEDPSATAGRPIQLFSASYLQVTTPTSADWIVAPGAPSEARARLGWRPVALVPENARPGRGGLPLRLEAGQTQAIWIEVYTGRGLPAGTYDGRVEVRADDERRALPLELELFDFALPDEPTLPAMVYFEPEQVRLYQGRDLEARYRRFAHRHRIELVGAVDEAALRAAPGRWSGADYGAAHGYEGPGQDVGDRFAPASFYGPGAGFETRPRTWARADRWMALLARLAPAARTFLYMPDEPGPDDYPRIRALAADVHAAPGPGRRLPIFATSGWVAGLDGAVDIWCSRPGDHDPARALLERRRGHEWWIYNGGRPHAGALVIDAPATDARATIWACFKHRVDGCFYWHADHWEHNSQKRGERRQDVWGEPITFDNRGQAGGGVANGDGVLLYPGEERLHPGRDRGIAGPCGTVQLANLRRGLQDHAYLTLAARLGLRALVDAALAAVVPRVLSEAGGALGFAEHGDAYEAARVALGRAIARAPGRPR